MGIRHVLAAAAGAMLLCGATAAEPLRLVPASPQPEAGALRPGLAVIYSTPVDVRSLAEAERSLGFVPTKGPPLIGFDYPDSEPGKPALTSDRSERVVAQISGFVGFDSAGLWRIDFRTNDGLRVTLGGIRVYEHDGRHLCSTSGWVEVLVPEPGWYAVEALWFQRLNTSCLLMRWRPPGGKDAWTPNAAFAFLPD
jgi:hypothetical protein